MGFAGAVARQGRSGRPHVLIYWPAASYFRTGIVQTTGGDLNMAKGYWVAFADVTDPEGYKAYIAENAEAFRKYRGCILTRGGAYEAAKGKPRRALW